MMSDFEQSLLNDAMGVPIYQAASFFMELRSPMRSSMSKEARAKTAGWQDPPDETGTLEGQFEVPVEHVVQLMGNTAMNLLRLMYAGLIYSNSIRGPGSSEVRSAIQHGEWDHKCAFESMVERMTVLAGPPHIPEPEMPPPSTNPIEVAKRMIRAEQEMVHAYQELCAVLGKNPLKKKVESHMASCQAHIDELWRVLPLEFGTKTMTPRPPTMLQRVENAETPLQEEMESPDLQLAEETVGVEPVEHVVTASAEDVDLYLSAINDLENEGNAAAREVYYSPEEYARGRKLIGTGAALGTVAGTGLGAVAAGRGRRLLGAVGGGLAVGASGAAKGWQLAQNKSRARARDAKNDVITKGLIAKKVQDPRLKYLEYDPFPTKISSVKQAAARMVKWAKDETDAELEEKGRQRGVANIAAEHYREKARRGERTGKSVGAVAGVLGGGVVGRHLIGGRTGTIAGAALGGLAGRATGGELGQEIDILRREKKASPQALSQKPLTQNDPERGWGEFTGGVLGGVAGGAGGATLGGLAGGGTLASLALGGAGMTAGGLAGEAIGSRLGRQVDRAFSPSSSEIQKAAEAMVLWSKTADPMLMASPHMASPSDQPDLEPINYMQAESIGRKLQDQNEANFYKMRAAKVQQEAQQVAQQATMQAQQATTQAQAVMEENAQASAKIQQALMVAEQAKAEALAKTEQAARERIGTMDLRAKLLEIASHDPIAQSATNLAAPPPQPPQQGGMTPEQLAAAQAQASQLPGEAGEQAEQAVRAQGDAAEQQAQAQAAMASEGVHPGEMAVQASARIPDAKFYPPENPEGPVAYAPSLRTAPGSAPPEGAPDRNANSSGPHGPDPSLAASALHRGNIKSAGIIGALGGGILSAGHAGYKVDTMRREGVEPALERVRQLSAEQDGSFRQAAALARAKKDAAERELLVAHPGRRAVGIVGGDAIRGAIAGDAIENKLHVINKLLR